MIQIVLRLTTAKAKLIYPIYDANEGKNRLVQVKKKISGKFINNDVREKLQTKVLLKKFPNNLLRNFNTLLLLFFLIVISLKNITINMNKIN